MARLQHTNDPWETEVFAWIKGDGAPKLNAQKDSEVIVYAEGDELIGFSGIGPYKVNWPEPDSDRVKHLHVIAVGLDQRYRRLPEGPREQRYSWRILESIAASVASKPKFPRIVTLFVHPLNARAIKLYCDYGFRFLPHQVYVDPETRTEYPMMVYSF